MRNAIFVAASVAAFSSPTVAVDMPEQRYGNGPTYQREVEAYEYEPEPPVVIQRSIVVGRPVVVAPPPAVVDEYPIYATPRFYAGPPLYAYAHRSGGTVGVITVAVGKISD